MATYTATDDEDDGDQSTEAVEVVVVWGRHATSSPSATSVATDTCDDPPVTAAVELRFKDSPNFEAPTDSGRNNVYNVTVTVTDSRGRTDSVDVAVTVTNVEEDGESYVVKPAA